MHPARSAPSVLVPFVSLRQPASDPRLSYL
jgi:hypothetical protein